MADEDPPQEHVPAFLCSLCRQGIQTREELAIFGVAAVHAACLERSDASDLANIGRQIDQDRALRYKGYRLESQSHLNLDSRRWIPRVVIIKLTGSNDPWTMLTADEDEKDTPDAADAHALAIGRRWVDDNSR
jgi:hypothetical protein